MKAHPVFTVDARLLAEKPRREVCLSEGPGRYLQNMGSRLVFLYLRDGRGFWMFLETARGGYLRGRAFRGRKWTDTSVALARVAAFY